MSQLDFGVLIHATPRGGTIDGMRAMNERLLQVATEYNLSAWFVDHLQFDRQPLLECFAFLAHTAGRYPRLRYGTLVLGQSYRSPALTAKIASSLQFLTDDRFILGIGAGWKEDEYRAYGYAYPPARERIIQLDEAVHVIEALWRDDPATFQGAHYRVEEAYNEPRGERPPTLMIGGGGERHTLRVVAEHADWWNADYYPATSYARKLGILHERCREVGRDPSEIVPTYYAGVSISYAPERLVRRPPFSYRDDMCILHGDPDAVTRQLEEFASAGARLVQLNFLDFPRTEGLELFVEQVLPRFDRVGL